MAVARIADRIQKQTEEEDEALVHLRLNLRKCAPFILEAYQQRWKDDGAYTVYRGGRLQASQEDVTGRSLVGGKAVVRGGVGGGREEIE